MGTILLFAVLLGVPLAIVLLTQQNKKRGYGRGAPPAAAGGCAPEGQTGKK